MKQYYRIDTNITSRVLSHWVDKGLVDFTRNGEKGWRTFTIENLIWLDIIKELRTFGVQLGKILQIKNKTQKLLSKDNLKNLKPLSDYYMVISIGFNISIIEKQYLPVDSSIRINLTNIISKYTS